MEHKVTEHATTSQGTQLHNCEDRHVKTMTHLMEFPPVEVEKGDQFPSIKEAVQSGAFLCLPIGAGGFRCVYLYYLLCCVRPCFTYRALLFRIR